MSDWLPPFAVGLLLSFVIAAAILYWAHHSVDDKEHKDG